jgi:DNA-binding transcriptional regulator YiaG
MGTNDLTNLSPVPELPEPGERIRLRQAFGVSQARLANALKVSRATVIAWEKGTQNPEGANREAYAATLSAWQETLAK